MSLFNFGLVMLMLGMVLGAFAFYILAGILNDRHETRQANFEFAGWRHTLPVTEQLIPRAYVAGSPPFGNAPKPGRHAAPTTLAREIWRGR